MLWLISDTKQRNSIKAYGMHDPMHVIGLQPFYALQSLVQAHAVLQLEPDYAAHFAAMSLCK